MGDNLASESLASRRTRVYRMFPARTLRGLIADKIMDDRAEQFEVVDVEVGEVPTILVSGETPAQAPEWASAVRSLTGVNLPFTSTTASAALFLDVDGVNYALTFGHGWSFLRPGKVDRRFGLDVAVRILDPDDIRKITRWALSAK